MQEHDVLDRSVEETPTTLREGLRGELLVRGDANYEQARALWNGVIDKWPAAIVKCRGAADVMRAVDWARDSGIRVAVRGGGHNVAGTSSVEDGLVIDLSEMNAVHVDPEAVTVTAEGGATIGDLDRETQAVGLAVPMGVVSATGIAGLTLGGGMGWLRRKHGLSCDALVAATVVTSDGRLVRASEAQNADLLWALRGGGGNFGVVTALVYRAFEVGPEVAFNVTFYPLEQAKTVFRAHDAFLRDEPGEVSTLYALGRLPDEAHVPKELHGRPFAAVLALHAGDAQRGWEALRPLREICEPLLDLSDVMPYLDAQQVFDADYPSGLRYYWKSASLAAVGEEVLDLLVKHAERAPSDRTTLDVWYNGGRIAEGRSEASAYDRRDLTYLINAEANWERAQDDADNVRWVRACLEELEPFSARHAYLNFPGFHEAGEAVARAAFGEGYARLARVKARFDPHDLFRSAHGVRPPSEEGEVQP